MGLDWLCETARYFLSSNPTAVVPPAEVYPTVVVDPYVYYADPTVVVDSRTRSVVNPTWVVNPTVWNPTVVNPTVRDPTVVNPGVQPGRPAPATSPGSSGGQRRGR